MEAQLFDSSFNEFFDSKKSFKSYASPQNDLELILIEKKSALSSMDFLEEEAERFEEEEEEEIVERKIKRFNSNCYLVSCRSETSEDFSWDSTSDI